jgi:hypothetical protein
VSNTRKPRAPRPPQKPKARFLLLRVAVQPTFAYVTDDGIVEVEGNPLQVPASTWPDFTASAFSPTDLITLQAQFEATQTDPGN